MAVWLSGGDAAGAVGGCRMELKGRRPGGRMTKRMKRREVARGGRLGRYEDAAGSHATSRDRGSLIN
jgi:hypothetical protein